jgi:hypothetical protein
MAQIPLIVYVIFWHSFRRWTKCCTLPAQHIEEIERQRAYVSRYCRLHSIVFPDAWHGDGEQMQVFLSICSVSCNSTFRCSLDGHIWSSVRHHLRGATNRNRSRRETPTESTPGWGHCSVSQDSIRLLFGLFHRSESSPLHMPFRTRDRSAQALSDASTAFRFQATAHQQC